MKRKSYARLYGFLFAMPLLAAAAFGCKAGSGDPNDPNNPDSNAPHALGSIVLGESHSSGGGSATPFLSAAFVPDAKLIKKCTTDMAGCKVSKAPKCGTGCSIDEVCKFDDNCQASCTKICDARCASDEECYFPSPDSPSCRKRETFDAGSIAFAGTTTTLTLFPPYQYSAMGSGAPYLERSELTVRASGATNAGYDKFEKKFTATTYLRTEPALNKLTKADVFGQANLPIKWIAGQDKIVITATGAGGTAVCEAKDELGSFDVPREVINFVVGDSTTSGQFVAMSVSRERKEVYQDLATKGTLLTQTVQPEAWLELTTDSSEAASFMGCSAGQALCGGGNTCTDVRYDRNNCGKCNNKCASSDSCDNGKCRGEGACQSCFDDAQSGACKFEFSACNADSSCSKLSTCMEGCFDSTCRNMCITMASQSARDKYNAIGTCLCQTTACRTECNSRNPLTGESCR